MSSRCCVTVMCLGGVLLSELLLVNPPQLSDPASGRLAFSFQVQAIMN